MHDEEAAAEVVVDGGAGALDPAEEPEGEDAHGEADEGDDHAQLGDAHQDVGVGNQLEEICLKHVWVVYHGEIDSYCFGCEIL